jgi:quinol monooxygenase YgiN
MNNLQLTARFVIHEGKLNKFKELAKACMYSTKEKDTGTLQYDWYFNDDETECRVRETYVDSDAILAHIGNLGPLLGELLEIADFYPELYGTPSEALVNATAALKPKVYSHFQSM